MSDVVYTPDRIKAVLQPVFNEYKIKKATLFGSYAKGLATPKSDVDLLLDSGLKGLGFVGLIEAIRMALDKDVDIMDITHIVPDSYIYNEINRDGVTIYEK